MKEPDETSLERCPWDAVDMVPSDEFQEDYGKLPYQIEIIPAGNRPRP